MRPKIGLSLTALIIGAAIGIGIGLFYTWTVNPVIRTDVFPWQLNKEGQTNWMIAASVAWARDRDIFQAANRLNELHLSDATFQRLADTACELARSSYAQSDSGLLAIRAMVNLAQGQGKTSCASDVVGASTPTLVPTSTVIQPTATLMPPPSKTPTPPPAPTSTSATEEAPTSTTAAGNFKVVRYEPYCSAKSSGIIEVLVQESNGNGIPGVLVQVDWPGGKDQFYTGLKPERGDGYADFKAHPDEIYSVILPGQGERSDPIKTPACTDRENGGSAITSYRIYFRRVAKS